MVEIHAIDSADAYTDLIASVVRTVSSGDIELARNELHPISGQVWAGSFKLAPRSRTIETPAAMKRTVTDRLKAATYVRDGFTCRYCGLRTIPLAVLVGISDVFPDEFMYHTNYKKGAIHPAFWLAPEADHLFAHARGGASTIDNLITLHAMCNLIKSDSYFEDLPQMEVPESRPHWGGLISYLPQVAEQGNGVHSRLIHKWMRLFEVQMNG